MSIITTFQEMIPHHINIVLCIFNQFADHFRLSIIVLHIKTAASFAFTFKVRSISADVQARIQGIPDFPSPATASTFD